MDEKNSIKNCEIIIEKIDGIMNKEAELLSLIAPYYADKFIRISKKRARTNKDSDVRENSVTDEKADIDNLNNFSVTAYEELLAGYMLYKYLGISKDEQMVRNEYGKPGIAAGYMAQSIKHFNDRSQRKKKLKINDDRYKIYFNLSHSGPYVVLAVSDRPVGIDIEKMNRMNWKIAKRILRKEQITKLEIYTKGERTVELQREFTKYWTGYEAIMKLIGTGFAGKISEDEMLAYEKELHFSQVGEYMVAAVVEPETKYLQPYLH